jgi:hypothetical protein
MTWAPQALAEENAKQPLDLTPLNTEGCPNEAIPLVTALLPQWRQPKSSYWSERWSELDNILGAAGGDRCTRVSVDLGFRRARDAGEVARSRGVSCPVELQSDCYDHGIGRVPCLSFFVARDIRWFTSLFLLYVITDFLLLRYAHSVIRQAVNGSYKRLRDDSSPTAELYAKAIEQIEHYYFVRPHDLRRFLVFFAMGIACLLAFRGISGSSDDPYVRLAYGLSIVTIIVSEIVIGYLAAAERPWIASRRGEALRGPATNRAMSISATLPAI